MKPRCVQVSAFARRTWTWGKDSGHGQSTPASPRSAHHHRHDRGRNDPACACLDQKPRAAARSGDAPDQERQSVVLRDEGPRGSGQQDIHTVVATAANVADSTVLADLLHGEETRVWGDQAYRGQTEVIRECAPLAQDHTHRRYRYKNGIDEQERAKNRTKSSVRSKVEHPFQVMKLKFGFVKVRYRGLKKNTHQLFVICGLVNLFLDRKKLLLATSA